MVRTYLISFTIPTSEYTLHTTITSYDETDAIIQLKDKYPAEKIKIRGIKVIKNLDGNAI